MANHYTRQIPDLSEAQRQELQRWVRRSKTAQALVLRARILHFTPTSASWINQVERWFAAITERQIRRGTHRSTTELEQAIEEYLRVHNENPKPFIWTKSADHILESLKIYCERISETGH